MDEKKQIEEMATAICDECRAHTPNCEYIICDSAIESAEAVFAADYRKQSGWISVDERLPDKMQEVLAYRGEFRGGMMNVYTHLGNGNWEDDYGYRGNTEHEGITHWMPLPEAPKGE